MKRAGSMGLLTIAAALAAAGCGGAARTTNATTPKTSAHTTTAPAPPRTTKPSAHRRPLPAFIAGKWSGTKPSEIDFSADAGNIVARIHWSLWTPTTAIGHGTSVILSCVPNCVSGKVKYVPCTITLSAPRGGHFTHLIERRNGQTLQADYGSPPWPLGASRGLPAEAHPVNSAAATLIT